MLNRISSSSHSNIHHGGELSPSSSSQSSTLAPDSPTQHLKPTFVPFLDLYNAYRVLDVGDLSAACIANGRFVLLKDH